AEPVATELIVVFAGRLIPEKRARAVPPAVARAAARIPALRGEIYGDGPERNAVRAAVARSDGLVEWLGIVEHDRVHAALARALCLVLPSRREGYGLVVVEAAARGTPSGVVRAPDNAALELVEHGVNGLVAESAEP